MTPGATRSSWRRSSTDGAVLESARSARAAGHGGDADGVRREATARCSRDGVALRASVVATASTSPTDLAFAPDGRIFVAERAGTHSRRPRRPPAQRTGRSRWPTRSARTDSCWRSRSTRQFDRTHHVFAIYTAPDAHPATRRSRSRAFARCRDTLGDRAVLLDGVAASSPSPSAALRFGPDGKLYAAFDDGGDARRRQDAGSLNGKVLRLNADGTTPADARGATPVYADGYGSPVAIDWDPPTATLWVADRAAGVGAVRVLSRRALARVERPPGQRRERCSRRPLVGVEPSSRSDPTARSTTAPPARSAG